MNFERPHSSERKESTEDENIVREELMGALLADVCAFDENGECEDAWFKKHHDDFQMFFTEVAANNPDILNLWITQRNEVCNMFHEKLNDLDTRRDLDPKDPDIRQDLAA